MGVIMGFLKLGESDAYTVTHFLYYIGMPVVAYKAIQFGKDTNLKKAIREGASVIRNGNIEQVIDGPSVYVSAVFLGILYLFIVMIIWKFICELILIAFKYFESNTKENVD